MRHIIVVALSTVAIVISVASSVVTYHNYQVKRDEESARTLQNQRMAAEQLKAARLKECAKQEAYWAALPQASRVKLEAPACRLYAQ
jgi:predicted metalloprotease